MESPTISLSRSISVIICTRDRPHNIAQAVCSVIAGDWSDFELLVLDQSKGPETQQAIQAIIANGESRVRYYRVPAHGKTYSLNAALDLAHGGLLAFTDDDCEAPHDWLYRIKQAFDGDDRLMLLVGAVVAGPHDSAKGFVPTFEPDHRLNNYQVFTYGSNPMGANMAMRASLPRGIGKFDPMLGVGAPLRSSYDLEYCYRAYRLGRLLCADPAIAVVHHGFRTWQEGRPLVQGYALGTAAAYMKFVRLGDPIALGLMMRDTGRYGLRVLNQVMHGRRPIHLSALLYRLRGITCSYRYGVDRSHLVYMTRQ